MSYRHLIRLLDDDRAHWLAQDRAGRVTAGPTDGFPTEPADETVVLVPSADVLLLSAPRVARQQAQLERAIPFAIEEQLVAPVEQLHTAILGEDGHDRLIVGVVARQQLEHWLARLAEHGVTPDRLLPEVCLLPSDAETVLLLDDQRASLRHAPAGVLSGTLEELGDWLDILADAGNKQPFRLLLDKQAPELPEALAGLPAQTIDVPAWLAGQCHDLPSSGMNVLSGDYAPRTRGISGKRAWAWAAALLIVGIGLSMTSMIVERWQLDRQYTRQRAEMETLLREALPDVQRIVDPRAQILGELSRRSGQGNNDGALPIIARVAPLLSGSGRYTLDALEYRNGTLDITLRSPDVGTLDELRETIAALGYQTELSSMVPGSKGVEGKLRVRGGGA